MQISRSRTHAIELDLSNVDDNLRTFILEYRSGSREIKQLVSSESLRTREHISASSKATFQAIGGIQKTLNSLTVDADVQMDHARRERLLQSLKFPGFNERRNQVPEAYEKTFQWIFMGDNGPTQEYPTGSDLEDSDWEDSDLEDIDLADPSEASWDLFSNWLSSTANTYWISGKPGSGKTTLVKYVLNHPKTATFLNIWSHKTLTISHFFWRPGNKMQQNIKGLLCSLLYQLLENSAAATIYVLQYIQDQNLGVKDAHTDWSVPELRAIFLETLSSYEHPICMFIDGLDEIDPADGPLELLDLVEKFPRYRNMKLCLASRPEPLLQGRLSAYPHLRLQDLTRADLDRYARDHIKLTGTIDDENTVNSSWISNAPWHLIESIVVKAEGVFLWLVLAIKSVNKGFTLGDTLTMIRERIACLPRDLTKLYKDMWNRACEDSPEAYRQIAALYFRLILIDSPSLQPIGVETLSVLQLMLASTSIADKLLDAIEKPSDLVPEERMLKECGEIERNLEICCFGLLEIFQESSQNLVVGWYGSQYSRLWSCYGLRRPTLIHRTARDFLLDTVDGKEILGHDASSESSILSLWIRAHLATSQLYADTLSGRPKDSKVVANHAETYTALLYRTYYKFTSYDPSLTRTVFYFERLCSSGQLLSGPAGDRARLCGGVEFPKVAGSICCDESIWPVSRRKTLAISLVSEILLNLCDSYYDVAEPWSIHRVESGINTLLHEGADPNWIGTRHMPYALLRGAYSIVQTPFTAYLGRAIEMTKMTMRSEQYRIAEVLGNLHTFLSRSAHLGNMLTVAFCHHHRYDASECTYSPNGLDDLFGEPLWVPKLDDSVIVSLSAHTILQALLDYIGKEFEHSQCTDEVRYGEIMWLIASIQKCLDNWSNDNNDRVIGRFSRERVGEMDTSGDHSPRRKLVWYVPSEASPAAITDMLLKELGFSLTEETSARKRCISPLVQQMSWTVQAEGFDETWESLAQLGILARVDFELHDIQGWVDKFQKQRSADGSFECGIEVAQSCFGGLNT